MTGKTNSKGGTKKEKEKTKKPDEATSTLSLAQLGENFSNMVTSSTDPNQANMAMLMTDLYQGKV